MKERITRVRRHGLSYLFYFVYKEQSKKQSLKISVKKEHRAKRHERRNVLLL